MIASPSKLQDVVSVALVVCALIITALVVRRELSSGGIPTNSSEPIVEDWMALASDGVSIGSPDDMPVVVFSDYLCPYCAVLDSSLSNVMQSEASNIRVVYRQFPIESIHPTAKTSARAALCAASFGWFEQVHDKLFGRLLQTDQDLQQLASDSGVEDVEQLLECVASERSAQRVEDDIRTGVRIGVVATPSLIINGRLIRGVIPRDSLESLVAIAP